MADAIDIELRRTESLARAELDEIWAVTARYIDTSRPYYEEKLHSQPEVGLWRTREGTLVGLVSLDVYQTEFEGRASTIIFTSSVVIEERFRGRGLALRTGLRVLLREKLRQPWMKTYWLFDTFSYKSYVVLPRNLLEFWPRRDRPTPPHIARFMAHLARDRYGDAWSPDTGVVHRSGEKRLLPGTAPIDSEKLANPDIAFFARANPGHSEGDMLVCLVPLTLRNLAGAVLKSLTR